SGNRNGDHKFREYALGALYGDFPSVRFDDIVANAKPKPGTFTGRFRGKKRFEYFFTDGDRYPAPVIPDANDNLPVFHFRFETKHRFVVRLIHLLAPGQGIKRIVEQV